MEELLNLSRRNFLTKAGLGLAGMAMSSFDYPKGQYATDVNKLAPHYVPKAKRVIYLFQAGGPSQLEMFDYKPKLVNLNGQELPESVRIFLF